MSNQRDLPARTGQTPNGRRRTTSSEIVLIYPQKAGRCSHGYPMPDRSDRKAIEMRLFENCSSEAVVLTK